MKIDPPLVGMVDNAKAKQCTLIPPGHLGQLLCCVNPTKSGIPDILTSNQYWSCIFFSQYQKVVIFLYAHHVILIPSHTASFFLLCDKHALYSFTFAREETLFVIV